MGASGLGISRVAFPGRRVVGGGSCDEIIAAGARKHPKNFNKSFSFHALLSCTRPSSTFGMSSRRYLDGDS